MRRPARRRDRRPARWRRLLPALGLRPPRHRSRARLGRLTVHHADLVAGAASARGVVIVIDVFRACSLVAHALAAGAERVLPVEGGGEAPAPQAPHTDGWLVGERPAKPRAG
ncbi:MAG: 2-phosphosulfolactate phosphatase, partial [Gammaproteobacteria bacterium]